MLKKLTGGYNIIVNQVSAFVVGAYHHSFAAYLACLCDAPHTFKARPRPRPSYDEAPDCATFQLVSGCF